LRVGDQIAEVIRAHSRQTREQRKQECQAMLDEVGFLNVERIYRAYPINSVAENFTEWQSPRPWFAVLNSLLLTSRLELSM